MKKLLVTPQKMCKDIDKAIKVNKEFMYGVDAKIASMSLVLPASENTNKKTKWGKISSCSKVYKELKELKKAVVEYKISLKDEQSTSYNDCKLDIALTSFAINFKEIVKNIILNKVVSGKEDRAFWDELLELFDKIGYQIMDDCELFETLGRYSMALKKKKDREKEEQLNALNLKMQQLEAAEEALKALEEKMSDAQFVQEEVEQKEQKMAQVEEDRVM